MSQISLATLLAGVTETEPILEVIGFILVKKGVWLQNIVVED